MTLDPEHQADILRALALGELDEDDPRAREVLDACEVSRAEWNELSRAIRKLDQAGGEDLGLAQDAPSEIREEDLARVRAFYLPRLRPAVVRRRRVQLAWALPAAFAMCGLLLWAAGPAWRSANPGLGTGAPEGPALMSEAADGLVVSARADSDGVVHVEWTHDPSHRRIPGTLYDLEFDLPGGAEPLRIRGLDEPRWKGRVEAAAGSRIPWRVTAFSEQEDYAHGQDVIVLPE